MFKFSNLPAIFKPGAKVLSAPMVPHGPNADAVQMLEVELRFEINASNALKEIEYLFPDAYAYSKLVNTIDACKGEDRVSRTEIPESQISLCYSDDKEPIVDLVPCEFKGNPKLKIDEAGNARLELRPVIKLPHAEMAKLLTFMDADMRLYLAPRQAELPGLAAHPGGVDRTDDVKKEDEEAGKKKTVTRKRSPALALAK